MQLNDIVNEALLNECIVNKKNILDNFIDEMFYKYVMEMINTNLIGRDRKVLNECFGINCIKKPHLEIAKELIITREHVYKIEAKALRKLRKQNDIKNIREYYNF